MPDTKYYTEYVLTGNTQLLIEDTISLNKSTHNVGIGTLSPSQKLVISGGTIQILDGREGTGKVLTSDAYGKGIWSNNDVFWSGSTAYIWNINSINVGVGTGTFTPLSKFNVHSASVSTISLTDETVEYNNHYGGAVRGYGVGGSGGRFEAGVYDNSIYTKGILIEAQSTAIRFYTGTITANNTERMLINSVGNVGINVGTTNPTQKLVVSGGTIQIINGNEGIGKVLTSDSAGIGSWATAASSSSGTSGKNGATGATGATGVSGAVSSEWSYTVGTWDFDYDLESQFMSNSGTSTGTTILYINRLDINGIVCTGMLTNYGNTDYIQITNKSNNAFSTLFKINGNVSLTGTSMNTYIFPVICLNNNITLTQTNYIISFSKSGPSGSSGTSGKAGSSGSSGKDGNTGSSGTAGSSGKEGNAGLITDPTFYFNTDTDRLYVQGLTISTGFTYTGTGYGTGKVLTSDASGNVSWGAGGGGGCVSMTCQTDGFTLSGGTGITGVTFRVVDQNITLRGVSTDNTLTLKGDVAISGGQLTGGGTAVGFGDPSSFLGKIHVRTSNDNEEGTPALFLEKASGKNGDDPFIVFSGVTVSTYNIDPAGNLSIFNGSSTTFNGPKLSTGAGGWLFAGMVRVSVSDAPTGDLWIPVYKTQA